MALHVDEAAVLRVKKTLRIKTLAWRKLVVAAHQSAAFDNNFAYFACGQRSSAVRIDDAQLDAGKRSAARAMAQRGGCSRRQIADHGKGLAEPIAALRAPIIAG